MCELCSNDLVVREAAVAHELHFADQLGRFEEIIRDMARGFEKPHDAQRSESRRVLARAILRELADEWI